MGVEFFFFPKYSYFVALSCILELVRLSAELKIKDGAEFGNKHFQKNLNQINFDSTFFLGPNRFCSAWSRLKAEH